MRHWLDLLRDVCAFDSDQPRADDGKWTGGGAGSGKSIKESPAVKRDSAKRERAGKDAAVKRAEQKVARAKVRVANAKDGLAKAQKELKDVRVRAKEQKASARSATSKAREAKSVDVKKHLESTKAFSDEAAAGREVGGIPGKSAPRFEPKLSDKDFDAKLGNHIATLGKVLNKAQAVELARGMGLKAPRTKKDALKAVQDKIKGRRGMAQRAYI